jgi:hypothetical protein
MGFTTFRPAGYQLTRPGGRILCQSVPVVASAPSRSRLKQASGEKPPDLVRRRDDTVRGKHLAVFLVKPFEVLMEVLWNIQSALGRPTTQFKAAQPP